MSESKIAKARQSWLNCGDPDREADAWVLCVSPMNQECANGRCAMDGWCFRGLGSAEVRWGIERRLEKVERDLAKLMETYAREETPLAQRVMGRATELKKLLEQEKGIVLAFKKQSPAHSTPQGAVTK